MAHNIMAKEFRKQAVEHAYKEEFDAALKSIEEALKLEPKRAEYLIEKSEILCEMEKPREGLKILESLGFDDPEAIKAQAKKIKDEIEQDAILLNSVEEKKLLDKLLNWGKANGAKFSKAKIVKYAEGFRGVHALRRIRKGERIMSIPEKMILTQEKAREACPLAKKVLCCGVTIDYPYATAMGLLIRQAKSDPSDMWHPMAALVPKDISSFPYSYNEAELQCLKGTSIFNHMKSEMKDCEIEYHKIVKELPEFGKIPYKEYLTLTTLVCSRYFFLANLHAKDIMVPIVDMFNYYYEKVGQTYWQFDNTEKVFFVSAEKDIARGEIIGLNYGNKSTAKYLHYYGFCPTAITHDPAVLHLYFNKEDPLLSKKKGIIFSGDLFLRSRPFYLEYKEFEKKNDKVISYCRFIAYKGDIMGLERYFPPTISPSIKYKKLRVPPLSLENEKDALQVLKNTCNTELKEFPRSVEKDQEDLNKNWDKLKGVKLTLLQNNKKNWSTARV